eukprot:jgi/Mesen1/10970/ME000096S10548
MAETNGDDSVEVNIHSSPTAADARRRQKQSQSGLSGSPVLQPLPHRAKGGSAGDSSRDDPSDNTLAALVRRHRFLLSMMSVLLVLCTIYLYFAISMGEGPTSCSGLHGADFEQCKLNKALASRVEH